MSTPAIYPKTTLLLAPALAPLTEPSPLASAVRDLALALRGQEWQVRIALGVDGSQEAIVRKLGQAGLARRLAPVRAGESTFKVYEGDVGDTPVLVFVSEGPPNQRDVLAAAVLLGQTPQLLQCWTHTASALSVGDTMKTIVHHDGTGVATGLQAADLVLLASQTAAAMAARDSKSPLSSVATKVRGLAPGLDSREWNPERDSLLLSPMTPPTTETKAQAKAALRIELGLKDADEPLIGVISNFEKLPRAMAAEILTLPVQIAGAGAGAHIEAMASRAPQRAAAPRGLSASESRQLRHRIVAASDFILLSSSSDASSVLFPCRYGTSIIAPNLGECGERIVNFDLATKTGSGFLFRSTDELMGAIRRAIQAWESGPETRTALIERCQHLDLSWQTTAMRFNELVTPVLQF